MLYEQESHVHEASMIHAIEPSIPAAIYLLSNTKVGTFHRDETGFTVEQELELGVYDLWSAWKIFEHRRNVPAKFAHFPGSRGV